MKDPLTTEQANTVYDTLVKHAGATEESREGFVYLQTYRHLPEYRFIGSLGFGGKFWRNNGRWYVTAYPEDMTPARQTAIDAANALATLLREQS